MSFVPKLSISDPEGIARLIAIDRQIANDSPLANQSNGSPIHLVIPALALRPSINELANILETEAYTEWNYMLTASCTPPSVFTGSREYVTIVSDSTLLNWGETWKSMVRGTRL